MSIRHRSHAKGDVVMNPRNQHMLRHSAITMALMIATVITPGVAIPAKAATLRDSITASFDRTTGTLTIRGDQQDNNIIVGRNTAGTILINGGAVRIRGGESTVANTRLVEASGLGGNDTITLNEASGPMPQANLLGGNGNDILTGGSGRDTLEGQAGNDTLLGKGGNDELSGGPDNDTLAGGDGDDQVSGEGGDDRLIWNPGDDTDLNEGGDGIDTVEANGGDGTEVFTATANGTRVRFDRVSPAPFSLDTGTSENVVLNANGGDDSFSATGNLAALIRITVDGGAGNDTIRGSNGADQLLGGDGNDFVDGQQGNDVVSLGAGDDTFQWDPGDGNDVVEGQAGSDIMRFNGSPVNEAFGISANGGRVRFTRDVASVSIDLDDVERIDLKALGGADNIVVNDLSGTNLTEVNADLAAAGGGGDGQPDGVIVNSTGGDDFIQVVGDASGTAVSGLAALVSIAGAEEANDRLSVNTLVGDDVMDASGLASSAIQLRADGGSGNDVLIGGAGNDVLLGGDGDDVLIGGPGIDTLDGGPGNNIIIQD